MTTTLCLCLYRMHPFGELQRPSMAPGPSSLPTHPSKRWRHGKRNCTPGRLTTLQTPHHIVTLRSAPAAISFRATSKGPQGHDSHPPLRVHPFFPLTTLTLPPGLLSPQARCRRRNCICTSLLRAHCGGRGWRPAAAGRPGQGAEGTAGKQQTSVAGALHAKQIHSITAYRNNPATLGLTRTSVPGTVVWGHPRRCRVGPRVFTVCALYNWGAVH